MQKSLFFRSSIFIGVIVVISNITVAALLSVRFFTLSDEQRRQLATRIEEGRSILPPDIVPAQNLLFHIPWTLLIPVVVGLLLVYVYMRSMVRPLKMIEHVTQEISKGNFKVRAEIPKNADEFAVVGNSLNLIATSLERIDAERKSMFADIAHELRNPLTAIQTRLEGLEDGFLPLNQTEVHRIQLQVRLLARLVEDLRTLSLAEEGKLSLHKSQVEILSVVDPLTHSLQLDALDANVSVKTVFENCEINADRDRIHQVIGNLLQNALRYTPKDGVITVAVHPVGKECEISVENSGDGLPEEAIPHLFDRFYRADQSRSRSSGGSGLGLAIAKALVELHGGTISAYNSALGFATFKVSFPLSS